MASSSSLLVNPPNASLPLVNPTTGAPALGSGGLAFLQGITSALNGTKGVAATNVNQVTLGTGTLISAGTGVPNGVVSGNPGDLYMNLTGGSGATLWIKESGAGTNTGWTSV
jgi:hypothetical protein